MSPPDFSPPAPPLTDVQYVELERKSGLKHEFFAGEAFPLPTPALNHRIITGNFTRHLGALLKGRCHVGGADLRLKVESTGLLTYPDLFVTRGELTMVEPGTTLINPIVIGEVLSPTTELYVRTAKFEHYRQIPTLSTFLLISQNAPVIEQFSRETDTAWLYSSITGPHASMDIPALKVTVSLAEVYAGVEFGDNGDFLRPFRRFRSSKSPRE